MKSKTKTKKTTKPRKPKVATYEAYVLGLILIGLLLSEYGLVLNASAADWKDGVSVLDVSSGVVQMKSDLITISQPAIYATQTIMEFYNQATIATIQLLTPPPQISNNPLDIVYNVTDFYRMASVQMANVLDLSDYVMKFAPQVAGASISR